MLGPVGYLRVRCPENRLAYAIKCLQVKICMKIAIQLMHEW